MLGMPIHYASGLAHASRPTPALASQAVEHALTKLDEPRADTVLLFLSAHFAHDPRSALVAAARTAQTLNIAGCTALGVITEDDWLVDTPAAAAMLISGTPDSPVDHQLTLAAPNTVDLSWLGIGNRRFGGVAGDATGVGPYKVWRQGQLAAEGSCELPLGTNGIVVSQGLAPVSHGFNVSAAKGFELHTLDGRIASATLRRSIEPLPPLHELGLALLDADEQIIDCLAVVALHDNGSVTVAGNIEIGQRVAWARRTSRTALAEMEAIGQMASPNAALMFSCAGRGPSMHDGLDREWQTLRRAWRGVPLAGFYGNGQIANLHGENQLFHQSVVVARLA